MLAFREVLLNAMEHGAGFDANAVIEVTAHGLRLLEVASDSSIDAVRKATGAPLTVAENVGAF